MPLTARLYTPCKYLQPANHPENSGVIESGDRLSGRQVEGQEIRFPSGTRTMHQPPWWYCMSGNTRAEAEEIASLAGFFKLNKIAEAVLVKGKPEGKDSGGLKDAGARLAASGLLRGGGSASTGTLQVGLTDAQSDAFENVFISIKEIRVVPAGRENTADDDPGLPVIATFATPHRVDVLTLCFQQDILGTVTLPAARGDVRNPKYSKIPRCLRRGGSLEEKQNSSNWRPGHLISIGHTYGYE